MYKFAKKNNIVTVIESEDLDVGSYTPKFDKEPFTDEEIEKLFDNADKIENAEHPLILIYSGMRIMEFLRLETKNIFIKERYMIGGSKTKAGKDRVIGISEKTVKFIEKYYNPDNKYLILNSEGKPYTYSKYIREIWNPLMEELGMNHTPHTCKHSCASMLDNAEVNTMVKKKILGHSIGGDITDRYTHKNIQQVIDGINMI